MMGIEAKPGLELPLIPGQIGQRIQEKAETVLEEHKEEMERVHQLIRSVFDGLNKGGIAGGEAAVSQAAGSDIPFCGFLSDYFLALGEEEEIDLLAEIMANEFEVRRPDDFEALVLYLYILTVLIVRIRILSEQILCREQALFTWSRMKNECLSCLPHDCRIIFVGGV